MSVIGIRSAWFAVRRVVNTVKQYNSQVSTDFEYMGYCIANIVAPAVQKLTKLLYTLLSYVNAVSMAWFGVNLFANSSAKSFQKMKASAKEIQKSLQGFDEMNVVSDSSSSNSNIGGVPSMDLSGMQGEVPSWLQWIIDNKDLVLDVLAGITTGLIVMKTKGLDPLEKLGIVALVMEVVQLIQDIIKFIQDPSFENFMNILRDIALIVGTIAALLRSMARSNRSCNSTYSS